MPGVRRVYLDAEMERLAAERKRASRPMRSLVSELFDGPDDEAFFIQVTASAAGALPDGLLARLADVVREMWAGGES